MMTMDRGGFYRGQYLILGGLLSPLDNRDSDKLDLKRLEDRLAEGQVRELVLAVRVSRLAQGIPLGGEVRHMDAETLRQSLKYRQEFKS